MQCPYPPTATEQPYLGTALLSPRRGRGDKRIPKESLPHDSPWQETRACMGIQFSGRENRTKKTRRPLTFGAWNVRTLLDRGDRPERRTALIARLLGQYQIDIAALSETRLAGETQLEEIGGGYTFYCIGKPQDAPRTSGVGFAIRTELARKLDSLPRGINDRLMTLRLKLTKDCFATIISAYAPTLTNPDDVKEAFYEDLNQVLSEVNSKDKLIILGDFNARVGRDVSSWPNVLGRHGTGKCNSNGMMLLSLCAQHMLSITNTLFQQADKYKNTWMHPRSRQWHMLDYVIVRQRDRCDVHSTRCMRGADCWSDHRLIRSKMSINIALKRNTARDKPPQKLNIARLNTHKEALQQSLQNSLSNIEQEQGNVEEEWRTFREAVYSAAADTLGFVKRKHQDWFDENEEGIKMLIDKVHKAHAAHLDDNTNSTKKQVYQQARQLLQQRLRKMKNAWWERKAEELQAAADNHDMKTLHGGLRAVYGPKASGAVPVRSSDQSSLLTQKADILARWAEHFSSVLNRESTMASEAIASLPQLPTKHSMADPPNSTEVSKALKQTTPGKAPGADGIPADIYRNGGDALLEKLTSLFRSIWEAGKVPQDFKDATIVHIYKRKGDKTSCDNHRGISLLCIAGKVLGRVILNRLITHVADTIVPESQCGFRAGRGTSDMVFAVRQLQEKCREQNQELHLVFVDLTKAFDTVNRKGLWKILKKFGCPDKLTALIASFHEGMQARVQENGDASDPFQVCNGVKQGCVLAPTLFSILFAAMLLDAFSSCDRGVYIQFRTDGKLFNLRRLQAKTKVFEAVLREFLFADDCALGAHSHDDLQHIMDRFADACGRFGLTISLGKTEAMFQPSPSQAANVPPPPPIVINNTEIKTVDKFCYLGSTITSSGSLDAEVMQRIGKASVAFGRLTKRLWQDHGIRLSTKIAVYKAVVLSALLYCCETWTTYRRQVKLMEQFHQRCLRKICGIKWQDRVSNLQVLKKCGLPSIECLIVKCQLRWTGHVVRMEDSRIPKMLLYGQLKQGHRNQGRPFKRYRDTLKANLKSCNINTNSWEETAHDRTDWKRQCKSGIMAFESKRAAAIHEKKERRKQGSVPVSSSSFICSTCGRSCASRIGLHSHMRRHLDK
ncbi:uncharacterized protein LOC144871797 [Branchiostoma floridae x Branchiostoma japonicum]